MVKETGKKNFRELFFVFFGKGRTENRKGSRLKNPQRVKVSIEDDWQKKENTVIGTKTVSTALWKKHVIQAVGRKAELPTESTDKVRGRSIKDLGAGKQLVLLFKRKIKLRKFVISIQHCHRNTHPPPQGGT